MYWIRSIRLYFVVLIDTSWARGCPSYAAERRVPYLPQASTSLKLRLSFEMIALGKGSQSSYYLTSSAPERKARVSSCCNDGDMAVFCRSMNLYIRNALAGIEMWNRRGCGRLPTIYGQYSVIWFCVKQKKRIYSSVRIICQVFLLLHFGLHQDM